MFDKDLMSQISSEINDLSEEEKNKRIHSLQQLLDNELKRRSANTKEPPKKEGFFSLLKKMFS